MKLKELIKDLSYTLSENTDIDKEKILDTDISDVIYDSRKVQKDSLFVCLSGSSLMDINSHNLLLMVVLLQCLSAKM